MNEQDDQPRCTACGGSTRRRVGNGAINCPWCRGSGCEPTEAELAGRSTVITHAVDEPAWAEYDFRSRATG